MDDRFEKQMQFILELDKMKEIERQTYIADGSRKENDAEHSFHLAIMAFILAEHDVVKSSVIGRNARTHEGSEKMWDYASGLIDENVKNGRLKDE